MKMADIKAIGERIYQRRKELKLTLQEIADYIGVTKSTIQRYEAGKITTPKLPVIDAIARALMVNPMWLIGKSDKMEISPSFASWVVTEKLPLLTLAPDGKFEYSEEVVKLNDTTEKTSDFCIRMSGDSMIGARIYDGDIVFIKGQPDVSDGDIAAVMIDSVITLKRVFKIGERLQLRAENPAYPPVTVNSNDESLKILGKAVSFQSVI